MKALLIIWIGWGHAQTLAIDHFDTMEECQAVVKVMANKSEDLVGECLPREQRLKFHRRWGI